jgi:GMP synthase-like glutamine amidotransferase
VHKSPVVEIGWSDLVVNQGAECWFGGDSHPRLFQWHSEAFCPPTGATLIASGQYCPPQAFTIGGIHLGMQFHCEVDVAKVQTWLEYDSQELIAAVSPAVQPPDVLLASVVDDIAHSQRIADALYTQWLAGVCRPI